LTRWHPEAVHPAHEEFADDVALLLDGVGGSSAVVIGHDWGASEYRLNTNVQFEECDTTTRSPPARSSSSPM
jgi:hypothetical protein